MAVLLEGTESVLLLEYQPVGGVAGEAVTSGP